MDESTIEAVKKYWPWAVGLLGVVFIYSRMGGGGAAQSPVQAAGMSDAAIQAQLSSNVAIAQAAYAADTQQAMGEFSTVAALSQNLSDMTGSYYGFLANQAQADSATVQAAVSQAVGMGEAGIAGATMATQAYAGAVGQSIQSATAMAGQVASANANGPASFLGGLTGLVSSLNPLSLAGKSIFTTGGIVKV